MSEGMTELEALKIIYARAHQDLWSTKADEIVKQLIDRVEQAEADPQIALDMADTVLQANGRYMTFCFSRVWLIDNMQDILGRDPTDDEIQAAADFIMASEDIGNSEAAYCALEEWFQGDEYFEAK